MDPAALRGPGSTGVIRSATGLLLYRRGMDGRDGWTPTCSRVGCDAPAAASLAFDAVNCLAWLDTVEPARGAGYLCGYHAERITPPRGWSMLDRRSPEPMLFVQRGDDRTPAPAAGRPRPRRPKRTRAHRSRHLAPADDREPGTATDGATGDEPELPFDALSPTPRAWSVRDLPALDNEFDARTPMLAKAFESLRRAQAEPAGGTGDMIPEPPAL
jgi:hypothetical protein